MKKVLGKKDCATKSLSSSCEQWSWSLPESGWSVEEGTKDGSRESREGEGTASWAKHRLCVLKRWSCSGEWNLINCFLVDGLGPHCDFGTWFQQNGASRLKLNPVGKPKLLWKAMVASKLSGSRCFPTVSLVIPVQKDQHKRSYKILCPELPSFWMVLVGRRATEAKNESQLGTGLLGDLRKVYNFWLQYLVLWISLGLQTIQARGKGGLLLHLLSYTPCI